MVRSAFGSCGPARRRTPRGSLGRCCRRDDHRRPARRCWRRALLPRRGRARWPAGPASRRPAGLAARRRGCRRRGRAALHADGGLRRPGPGRHRCCRCRCRTARGARRASSRRRPRAAGPRPATRRRSRRRRRCRWRSRGPTTPARSRGGVVRGRWRVPARAALGTRGRAGCPVPQRVVRRPRGCGRDVRPSFRPRPPSCGGCLRWLPRCRPSGRAPCRSSVPLSLVSVAFWADGGCCRLRRLDPVRDRVRRAGARGAALRVEDAACFFCAWVQRQRGRGGGAAAGASLVAVGVDGICGRRARTASSFAPTASAIADAWRASRMAVCASNSARVVRTS